MVGEKAKKVLENHAWVGFRLERLSTLVTNESKLSLDPDDVCRLQKLSGASAALVPQFVGDCSLLYVQLGLSSKFKQISQLTLRTAEIGCKNATSASELLFNGASKAKGH